MRTIQIYKFNELRPEVQRKVITKNISPVMNVTRNYLADVWSDLVLGLAGSELIFKDSVIVDVKHQVWFARLDPLSY